MLPWPELGEDTQQFFRELIQREVKHRRWAYMNHEPFQDFLLPMKVRDFSDGGQSLAFDPKTLLGEEGEKLIAAAYGLDQSAAARIERDVIEALEFRRGVDRFGEDSETENDEQGSNEGTDFVLDFSEKMQCETLFSYCLGCIFGRWDARIAIDPSLAPELPDPFDPLPVCPPGMLVNPDGLPAEPGRIVSGEWLRARPDANTLPAKGTVKNPTIPDSEYPLRINWDGILVDDPGLNGAPPHRDDIVRRVREVLDLLWKDKAQEIEQEACDILGVSDLREYFRQACKIFSGPSEALFQEPSQGPDLPAALHSLRVLHNMDLLSPLDRSDPLRRGQQIRRAQNHRGRSRFCPHRGRPEGRLRPRGDSAARTA